jgi:hypothetical protein
MPKKPYLTDVGDESEALLGRTHVLALQDHLRAA